MSAATRTCPKCGGPLTPAAGDPARRTCAGCGVHFSVRPKAAVAGADPAPTAPTEGMDPRVKLALLIGLPAAFLCLCLMGIVVLTVVLWPRSAVKPTLAVAAPPEAPPPVLPADDAKPAPADDPSDPPKPPKKPDPPKVEAPPVHEAPPPLAPDPNPRPAPADPNPVAAPNPPADPPPADPVNQAIDKAVVYLKRAAPKDVQAPNAFPAAFGAGNQTGTLGLIGLALLESGVPADDPAVVACTSAVRAGEPTCGRTYEMAICLWFLDCLGDPNDEDLIRDLGARLIAGQLEHGLWTYNCPLGNTAAKAAPGFPAGSGLLAPELTQEQLKELMETLDKYDPSKEIPAAKRLAPVCHYVRGQKVERVQAGARGQPGLMMMGGGDLSLTQFAVLGLWVARKHHMPVDRSLLMTEAHVRAWQAADGGWGYNGFGGMAATDSMTCSGLMELAVGRAVSHPEGAKTEAADPQFEKGLEYLADLFGRGIPAGDKVKPANAAQAQNLAAAVAQLKPLQIGLSSPLGQNPANWKRDLKAFQDELERSLALDLPSDAQKGLKDIDDQIKKYEAARNEEQRRKEKTALEELLQKTTFLQGPGLGAFGLVGGPDRLLRPGKNNRMNQDDIYCLWSLERLCMVCDLKTVAGYDWYAWGAKLLVDHQNDDGGWNAGGMCPPVVETCMAVLFLKRVNVAKDLTAQLKTVAPVKDLSPEKLKFITTGQPPPGLTQPAPAEPPPEDAPKQTPKP